MSEVWIKKAREFETMDKNADLVVTSDEAPDLVADPSFDTNKSGDVTLAEWMGQKDNFEEMSLDHRDREIIFNNDLMNSGLTRFREMGITNKYDALIGLMQMRTVDEKRISELFDIRAPVISTLIAMGFSQEEALQTTAKLYEKGISEKLEGFGKALERSGITTPEVRNAVIGDIFEKRMYEIFDDIDKMYTSFAFLGCSESETQEIFTYYYNRGYVWRDWLDVLSVKDSRNTIFSVIPPYELKELILNAARTDDSGILPTLIPKMVTAIDALRAYGADSADIRRILVELMPRIDNGAQMIIKDIPDVLDAFSRLNIKGSSGPVKELMLWLNSIDPKGNAFWAFHSLPQEVDWLNSTFQDPAELNNIIAGAFLKPFSLISFHKLYDKFSGFGLKNLSGDDLSRFMARAGITFIHDSMCGLLDAIKSLNISPGAKRAFGELMLSNLVNPINLIGIENLIDDLKEKGFNDADVYGIILAALPKRYNSVADVLSDACSLLKKLGIGTEAPAKMVPYLTSALDNGNISAELSEIKYSNNALRNTSLTKEDLKKIEEDFPLGETGPSEFWDFLMFVGNHRVPTEETRALDYYIDICKRAKEKLGITRYGRYSPKIFEAALSGERKEKHAFVPVARDDWNGAFYSLGHDLELLLANGYSIDIVEASNEQDVYQALDAYSSNSIDLLFINGHGQPDQITLSKGTNGDETSTIDTGDSEWKDYLPKMKNGGKVIFASCSTGKGAESVIYKFKDWSDDEKNLEFVAPPDNVSSELIIGPDGVPDVEFRKDYNPLDPVRLIQNR